MFPRLTHPPHAQTKPLPHTLKPSHLAERTPFLSTPSAYDFELDSALDSMLAPDGPYLAPMGVGVVTQALS